MAERTKTGTLGSEPTAGDETATGSVTVHEETVDSDATAGTVRLGENSERSGAVRPAPPARIGRYVVVDSLGEGGMGVVYRAFDPELNRSVAVKLVLVRAGTASQRMEAQTRLQREGQALAQVNHRNVVSIYDVGLTDEGDVFIAMELVDGLSLADYCKNKSWRQIADVYRGAADGLAACHRRGLVHRDFKPSNVMVDGDGRAVILDFGLARAGSDEEGDSLLDSGDAWEPGDEGPLTPDLLQSPLTAHGVVRGTPAYMSPEQFSGAGVGPASDQFSFCVALWIALFGERPFPGKTAGEVKKSVLAGALATPKDTRAAPAWVRETVARGLANKADDRWSTMSALSRALGDDPGARRRRRLLASVAVTAVVAGVASTAISLDASIAERCTGSAEYMVGVWDSARRQAVDAAFARVEVSYAATAWGLGRARLDDYANSWQRSHRAVCEATTVRGEQTDDVMALRMQCLHRARRALSATVDVLETADDALVQSVHKLSAGLPSLAKCDDVAALLEGREDPKESDRAAVEGAEEQLTRAQVLRKAGRHKEALAVVDEAFETLGEVQYAPFRARLMLERAGLLSVSGAPVEAETATREVITYAARHDLRDVMAEGATDLMWLQAALLQQADEALEHAAWAEGLAAGNRQREARYYSTLAAAHHRNNENDAARAAAERGLELYIAELGPEHHNVPAARVTVASIVRAQGDFEAAAKQERLAAQEFTAALGAEHPFVAIARANLGATLLDLGQVEEAEKQHRLALKIATAAWGPEHPYAAAFTGFVAASLEHRGEYEEAEEMLRRSVQMQQNVYGNNHPLVVEATLRLAGLRVKRGDSEDAEALVRAALADMGEPKPTTAALVVRGRAMLARLARERGDLRWAETETRAIAEDAESLEGADGVLALALRERALVLLALGRADEAVSLLEKALEAPGSALAKAETEFAMARALWKADATRALELARTARRNVDHATRGEIETWLAGR